jgi:clan AA aspartic protease
MKNPIFVCGERRPGGEGEKEEVKMEEVTVEAKIKNYEDEVLARRGLLKPEEIREVKKEVLVDTGATMLTLPEEVVEELGLTRGRFIVASYADGTKKKRQIARGITIEVMGREAEVECVVEVRRTRILLGQIPLEAMDFIVDPKTGKLMPRPESPDMPLIDILSFSAEELK